MLGQYFRVLALSVVTFIAILFVSRFQQIAAFAALGASGLQILMFAFYLIPYVLPIALPISCLISSLLLMMRLSHTVELTALRSAGLALREIVAPILLAASLLTLVNFYVASELATHCHLLGKKMQKQRTDLNALSLLQHTSLLRVQDIFVDMRTIESEEQAEDAQVVMYNPKTERLGVINAKRLTLEDEGVWGIQTSVITGSESEEAFDHLMIENQNEMWAPNSGLAHLVKHMSWQPKSSHLRLNLLLRRIREDRTGQLAKYLSEIFRRMSLGLAAFTMTLMGCAFGVEVGRFHSRRGVIFGLLLTAFFIGCFMGASSVSHNLALSITLYLVPHAVIIPLSIVKLYRTSRGCEAWV